ncbi:MAG: chloride channel protein [Alphaproteobacteria bacterium]
MRPRTAIRLRLFLRHFARSEQVVLVLLAVVVGIAAGYGALAFRLAAGAVQWLGFGVSGDTLIGAIEALPPWRVILVPTAGGLIVGLFLWRFLPGGRPHGIPHIIEAATLDNGRMPVRAGIVTAVAHAASVGVGASTGREGPVVHLGAFLASWAARRLRLDRGASRTLLGCGAAAATGALFNAPMAGVLFALELVIGHHALRAAAPVVVAAVAGTAIGRYYFGPAPAFAVPALHHVSFWEFPAFLLLGLASAVAAGIFMRAILAAEAVAARSRLPVWLRPAVAGLGVGLLALWLPQLPGAGYEATDTALHGAYGLDLYLILIVAKIVATALCLGFGFGGGVFGPALTVGAMVGGAFGTIAGSAFPDLFSGISAYALIGMAAVGGAVLGVPLTTIFIVFELTGSSAMTIAVMVATVIASLSTRALVGRSIFHLQLARRGVMIDGADEAGALRAVTVADVMHRGYVTVAPDADLATLRERVARSPEGEAFVVDAGGRFAGVVSWRDLLAADGRPDATAGALARAGTVVLLAGDTLSTAIDAVRGEGDRTLPVLHDRADMKLAGAVREADLLRAWNRALRRAREEAAG